MLNITIPGEETFNSKTCEFTYEKATKLVLEHSLVSISKWEAKYCKPFLSEDKKTVEEMIDYIRMMTIGSNIDPNVYKRLTQQNITDVQKYIDAPMTATWFSEDKKSGPKRSEQVTSELIYYWMTVNQIPFECEKWHLNRLMTLIRVCNVKNQPPKKMSKAETMAQHKALNAARRKK